MCWDIFLMYINPGMLSMLSLEPAMILKEDRYGDL